MGSMQRKITTHYTCFFCLTYLKSHMASSRSRMYRFRLKLWGVESPEGIK